jgi:hypothetical protein
VDATPWSAVLGRRVTGPGGRSIRTVTPPQPRLIRLDDLKTAQEKYACLLVAQVLDVAQAEAWDVDGRQGAVDVMLTYRDGRTAALEVTNLGEDDAFDIARPLKEVGYKWPAVADWFWRVEIGAAADLARLEGCYGTIARICEAAGQPHPERLVGEPSLHPDVHWLVHESSSEMVGFPSIAVANLNSPRTEVVPRVGGGFLDESLSGFADGLATAFEKPHIARHFKKLARAVADERHLFIPLHHSALPFSVSSELMFNDALPPDPPEIPDTITHLWLAPDSSGRVPVWTKADGWRNFPAKPQRASTA